MSERGFTLVELLLSVAILTLLTGLSLPVYESFVRRNDLETKTQTIVSAIRRAESYARGVRLDSAWGMQFSSSSTTLFKGTTYASRDQAYDETIALGGVLSLTGPSEIVFAKLTAIPSATGTIQLSTSTNDTRSIVINAEGMVSY